MADREKILKKSQSVRVTLNLLDQNQASESWISYGMRWITNHVGPWKIVFKFQWFFSRSYHDSESFQTCPRSSCRQSFICLEARSSCAESSLKADSCKGLVGRRTVSDTQAGRVWPLWHRHNHMVELYPSFPTAGIKAWDDAVWQFPKQWLNCMCSSSSGHNSQVLSLLPGAADWASSIPWNSAVASKALHICFLFIIIEPVLASIGAVNSGCNVCCFKCVKEAQAGHRLNLDIKSHHSHCEALWLANMTSVQVTNLSWAFLSYLSTALR
jgi:hypothetical protein